MADTDAGPRALTATELKAQIDAERAGQPFLVYRDDAEAQRIVALDEAAQRLWIGRSASSTVPLEWDAEVSGVHAELERSGENWILIDDGLSRNGSYVNGERLRGRRRLRDRDAIRVGRTVLSYRAPGRDVAESTIVAGDMIEAVHLSNAQRKVLVALCRPFKDSAAFAKPATNQQIAEELVLSVDAVKTHLRALFARFGVDALPQNAKRLTLVERALASGLISGRDL